MDKEMRGDPRVGARRCVGAGYWIGGRGGEEDVFALENPTLTTEEMVERFKRPYLDRLYDISAFVGEIKQRFRQWYNLRSERNGQLWEDRFKSVLVQGEPGVLATVAAYIDLKAVRGDRERSA